MLQANMGYGCYCIKYKQRWDGVKIAVSNTGNIEVQCIKYDIRKNKSIRDHRLGSLDLYTTRNVEKRKRRVECAGCLF
jgi:hypothetical protein